MEELQKQLRCSICNKPLSVPPIYHENSIGSICGRCSTERLRTENSDTFIRQRAFEDIANYLFFPCSFQVFGCRTVLKWGSVENHENICNFNNIMCPLSHEYFHKQCSWIDEHRNLAEHIKANHKKMFCSPPIMKITKKLENRILFWEIAGRVIIIILVFKNTLKQYFCFILGDFIPEHCNFFKCELSIFGDNSTRPLVVQQEGIKPFDVRNFMQSEENFKIDIKNLEDLFSTSNELTLKFSINKGDNSLEQGLNEKLLHQLECPVCFEYMKPPIFMCETGHNFCEWCYSKIEICPICRGNLLGGRNFTLEELTNAVIYPCVYRNYGCYFVASAEKVTDHERLCPYVGRKCFMKSCEWKGLHGDLLKHLKDQHLHEIYQFDEIYCCNMNVEKKECLLIHNNDIFLLKILVHANKLVQFAVLTYEREATNYKYELQLIGRAPCINLTLSNSCQSVPFHLNIMAYDDHNFYSLPSDFIQQFMPSYSGISFKLKIFLDKEN